MQGQRSDVSSLPETFGFDHGSASRDAGIDQQVCWNSMRNSAQNTLSDYVLSPGDTSIAYSNSTSQEVQNLNGWNLCESSSSAVQNQASHIERRAENGCSSSLSACAGAGPILEQQQYEPANILSLNNANVNRGKNPIANGPLFLETSSSDSDSHDLNINPRFVGHGAEDSQVVECLNAYNPGGSENVLVPSASGSSDPLGVPSRSNGFLVEANEGRPDFSLEGRRLSCKRKALEGNAGQSSGCGSSAYFQHAEGSVWPAVPPRCSVSSSLTMSTPSGSIPGVNPLEQINPRLGLGVGGAASGSPFSLGVAGSSESSQRNLRLRINASHQRDSTTSNVLSTGSVVGHGNLSSSRHLPLNNSLDLRAAPSLINATPQGQPVVRVPSLRRNLQSSRWNAGSSSRPGSSSSCLISGERDSAPHEEFDSRSMPRNISEHPMFVAASEMRNSAQNQTNWNLTGGNLTLAGNSTSSSRAGSSTVVHPSSSPSWVPHRSSPQYPRQLSEFVRRSLLSSADAGSSGQSNNYSPLRSGPSASSQEMALSSGASHQGHPMSHPRSAMLLERQLNGAFGIPYSLQTLAAASEGRSRLVSGIRNVLDLMRRGEGLRFEDVMILDQSVFFGMADIHDRHRDMRLDVDNMSYEELLALEERIGNVSTGLSEETILKRLKWRKYFSITSEDQQETEPCCICQEEYNNGEDLGKLECGHDFHADCIKQWLMHKNLCPICKTTGLSTS